MSSIDATSSTADENATASAKSATRFDTDPADPTRKVPHKKANSPFLVHQRWKEQQQQKEVDRLAKAKAEPDKMAPKIVELPADSTDTVMTTAHDAAERASAQRRNAARKPDAKATSNGKAGAKSKSSTPPGALYLLIKWTVVLFLLSLGAGQFIAGDILWGYRGKYVKKQTYFPPTHRIFSVEELWEHNGKDPDKPIYLSVLGNVYDVTSGRWVYGARGSYSFFAGRDASRAYVTGCFDTHLTHDLRGLTKDEIESIGEWKLFFDEHARYRWIGRADLPPIDPSTPIPAPCHNNAEQKDPAEVQQEQQS